jgi:hypothetical protein
MSRIHLLLLAVFLVGMLLCYVGVQRSKTLKANRCQPIWRADGGRNGFLIAGVVIMVADVVLALIL